MPKAIIRLCIYCGFRPRLRKFNSCSICRKEEEKVLRRAYQRLWVTKNTEKHRELDRACVHRIKLTEEKTCIECGVDIGKRLDSKYCERCRK